LGSFRKFWILVLWTQYELIRSRGPKVKGQSKYGQKGRDLCIDSSPHQVLFSLSFILLRFRGHQISCVSDWVRDFSPWATAEQFGTKVAWDEDDARTSNTHIARRKRAIPHSTMKTHHKMWRPFCWRHSVTIPKLSLRTSVTS